MSLFSSEPYFDSSVDDNQFTVVLYMHQLLTEEAVQWLGRFDTDFSSHESLVLVHTKNAGRINNEVCRNLLGLDVAKSSHLLCSLRDRGFLKSNSKGSATYYEIAEQYLENNSNTDLFDTDGGDNAMSNKPNSCLFDNPDLSQVMSNNSFNGELYENNRLEESLNHSRNYDDMSNNHTGTLNGENNSYGGLIDIIDYSVERRHELLRQLPEDLAESIEGIGQRINAEKRDDLVIKVCSVIPVSGVELGILFGRRRQWADQSLKSLHSRKLLMVNDDMKYISTVDRNQRHITDY